MARPPSDPAVLHGPDFVTETPAEMAKELADIRDIDRITDNITAERDLVNQLLGQAQAADAIRQISQTLGISKLAHVKKNNLFRSMKGMQLPNGLALKGTWDEFCGLLGMSDEKANNLIANLDAFGEEALDSMTRVGIGYRDLRRLRKLPADERTALIEAAKDGDKDSLLDLAETLIEKHAKEKEQAAKEKDALSGELAARDERIAKQRERIEKAEDETDRLRARLNADEARKKADPDAELESLEAVLTHHRSIIEVNILGPFKLAATRLMEVSIAGGQSKEEIVSAAFLQLQRAIEDARLEVGVKAAPTGESEYPWLKEDWAQPGYVEPDSDPLPH